MTKVKLIFMSFIENNKFYFEGNQLLSDHSYDEVIAKTINILNQKNDGEFEVIKLQIAYELAHIKEQEKIEKINNYFEAEINKIIQEIIQYRNPSKKDYDSIQIHKKIFTYLLVKTRQNYIDSLDGLAAQAANSLGISCEREIYAVLDGVLPKSGLPPFVSLSSQDKVSQLNNLSDIVTGIRLMNKELEKGGIGLISLKDMKKRFKTNLFEEIQDFYKIISETCESYSSIYDNIDINNESIEKDESEILEKVRKLIVYYRQVLSYLSMLSDDLINSLSIVEELSKSYEKEINYLNNIVDKKAPLSKEQAYPRFENLSRLYVKFQTQSLLFDIRENVFLKLQELLKQNVISLSFNEGIFERKFLFEEHIEKLDIYLKKPQPLFTYEPGLYRNDITIILPNNTADFGDIKLELKGVCVVTLLTKNGLVIEGKPDVVAKYKEKFYIFTDQTAANKFIDNPNHFLNELKAYVKKHPYLINLLNMTEEFPQANLSSMFRDKENNSFKYKSSSVMEDKMMQTLVHVYEDGLIDDNYIWNEWELKKQAIQLADIMKKKTVSAQTVLSHFRRENETQVYPLKETGVNTTVSKGTNLSIEKTYVSNIRKYDKNY